MSCWRIIGLDEVLVEVETDKARLSYLRRSLAPSSITERSLATSWLWERFWRWLGEGEEWAPSAARSWDPQRGDRTAAYRPSVAHVSDGGRSKPCPRCVRLARQQGIDLATVAGSGPGGRVLESDLLGAGDSQGRAESVGMRRKTIARRMTESWTTIPMSPPSMT